VAGLAAGPAASVAVLSFARALDAAIAQNQQHTTRRLTLPQAKSVSTPDVSAGFEPSFGEPQGLLGIVGP
jgi:hypothetical protein